jgi:hypothetical protein
MRIPTRPGVLLVALLLAGCASGGGGSSSGDSAAHEPDASKVLTEDLLPFAPRRAEFVLARGERRTLRVEPSEGGAVLWLEGGPAQPARMDVRRKGQALVFSGGPESTIELLRLGEAPGAEWPSGEAVVRFDGWERLLLAGSTFDAARIRVTTGNPPLQVVQTWWFAPGTGLLRLRSDRGGIFADEMSLAGLPR